VLSVEEWRLVNHFQKRRMSWPLCKPKDRTSDIYVQLVAFIERRFERPKATGEEKLDVLVEPNFCRRFL
jgi:hypothetical protein